MKKKSNFKATFLNPFLISSQSDLNLQERPVCEAVTDMHFVTDALWDGTSFVPILLL